MSQTGLGDSRHNAFKPWQTGIDLHPSQTAFIPHTNPKRTMTCMASLPTGRIMQKPSKWFIFNFFFFHPRNLLWTTLRNKGGWGGGTKHREFLRGWYRYYPEPERRGKASPAPTARDERASLAPAGSGSLPASW